MTIRSYAELFDAVRDRTADLTSQTLSLRGRAAAGAIGAATLGVVAFGSAVSAVASTGPATSTAATVAAATVAAPQGGAPGKDGAETPTGEVAAQAKSVAGAAKDAAGSVKATVEQAAKKVTEPAKPAEAEARIASAQDVIKKATSQIGNDESAGGNTKYTKWYMDTDHAKRTSKRDGGSVSTYKGAAWCDMFVTWVGEQTGAKGIGGDAYTVEHAKWFKKNDRWGKKPKPGAVVFFAWGGGGISDIEHVGLVVKENGNGTVKTIEGNTDDAVKKKNRNPSDIVGYGYPEYKDA